MAAPPPINIKVAVRCRPMNKLEKGEQCKCIVQMDNRSVIVSDPDPYALIPSHTFTFDHVYFMDAMQEAVYKDLGVPILESALNGYNGTIFAYGQTGAGKTHSITGTPEMPGIVPRMNIEIFERLAKLEGKMNYQVSVSFLEIYNENVHDLMNIDGRTLKVREHPKLGVYVEDLVELSVYDHLEIEKKMIQGNSMRHVAATKMNERSSRSHSVFTVKIEQRDANDTSSEAQALCAKINLVDLAGSERVGKTEAEGNTLKEAAMINTSLSALGQVINCLADPKKRHGHIPFRASKLTRLLQESLGGNTVTLMIAACSPADRNFEETLNTLQYANRAKNIQNISKKNVTNPQHIVKELRLQLEELQAKLVAGSGNASMSPDAGLVRAGDEMNAEIHALQDEQAQLTQKMDRERFVGLAKNGILQFKIHYYRKQKTQADAELGSLRSEVEAIREMVVERTARAARLETEAEIMRERKAEADKMERSIKARLRDMRMRSTLEKWRTYVAQSQKYAKSLKKQQDELASLREQVSRAQTLESRVELQAEAVQLLYEEAASRKTRSEELAAQLLAKGAELDALVAEIDGMMRAENSRIATLDSEIAVATQQLEAARLEYAELDGERLAAQELGREVDGRLHALLQARRADEEDYKRQVSKLALTGSS